MRHPTTRPFMAWCTILLLSLGPASAREPQTQRLGGTYTVNAAASDDVNKAIEAAVEGMGFFTRGPARRRLRQTNLPPYQRIVISYTREEVSITTDRRSPIRTPAKGAPVDWTREDGEKFKVSTAWEGGKLKQTFEGKQGQRVNLYSIADDDKTLTMQVTVTSPRLPRALTYKVVYNRVI